MHEFGHVVHILGFSPCQLRQLEQRFDEAYASGAYDTSEYGTGPNHRKINHALAASYCRV